MMLDEEKIADVFNKVRAVREYMKQTYLAPQGLVISVDELKESIETVFNVDIEMLEVTFVGEHIGGKVERYTNNRARIIVRSGQSQEWLRFVAVKELCHVLIDQKESWSHKGAETIRGLLREWELTKKNGNGLMNPADPLQSEYLAEIAAFEFIYPFEYRDSDIKLLDNADTTVTRIALDHDAPAYVISQSLAHHDTFKSCWEALS